MQRYSKMFGQSQKGGKNYDSVNATLLIKAGFIDQVMAGVYTFLPLGLRVLSKIEKIVKEEMDKVGDEMLFPSMSPRALWETTNRAETIDVLMSAVAANDPSKRKNDADYILNSTHEELVTPLAKKLNVSYRDLPSAVYQIQTKFRNEARPKSGIMRGREFRMKDLYSFHATEEDFNDYYELAKNAYLKTFDRLGLGDDTVVALASGGDFTKDYSHEFQTKVETGEDTIFYVKSKDLYYNKEVTPSKAVDLEENVPEIEMSEVLTEGITTVDKLVEFMKIPIERTVKTLIFKTAERYIAVAVRGDYEVNDEKLMRMYDTRDMRLATEEEIEELTGAKQGYAGPINLPETVEVVFDDSVENIKGFECGANKTNYHLKDVHWGRDIEKPYVFRDIKSAKEGDLDPETGEVFEVFKASEVGNIFPLGTKFTDAFDYYYTDEKGVRRIVYMGSYGLGTSRVMGVIAEKFNDENGLIWPKGIAPYDVHFITLGNEHDELAEELIREIESKGLEVLWDERDARPGEKFATADLIGIPTRVVLSSRSLENGGFELKYRDSDDSEILKKDELLAKLL